MKSVRIIFTTRDWNPASFLIRHMLPRSLLCAALSSHAIIDLGDGTAVEASMMNAVRRAPLADVLKGSRVVATREFAVPNLEAGLEWLLAQVGKGYDFGGAFGLAAPDRDWQEDDSWYCYELAAAFLVHCGLDLFWDRGHITERELLGVNPKVALSWPEHFNHPGREAITQ